MKINESLTQKTFGHGFQTYGCASAQLRCDSDGSQGQIICNKKVPRNFQLGRVKSAENKDKRSCQIGICAQRHKSSNLAASTVQKIKTNKVAKLKILHKNTKKNFQLGHVNRAENKDKSSCQIEMFAQRHKETLLIWR